MTQSLWEWLWASTGRFEGFLWIATYMLVLNEIRVSEAEDEPKTDFLEGEGVVQYKNLTVWVII